jgi:redox-sensing transcriptional repressor
METSEGFALMKKDTVRKKTAPGKQRGPGTDRGASREDPPGGRRASHRRISACGLFKRQICEGYLSALLEGCRTDKVAVRRVGRQNCAVFECVEERGIASCAQCSEYPCIFHDNLERICPGGAELRESEEARVWRLTALRPGPLARPPAAGRPGQQVPERTISRVRWYLAALKHFLGAGVKVVSSAEIAAKVGVNSALVRRDLCYFGQFGTRSLGYHVEDLLRTLLSLFEVDRPRRVAWLGAERLSRDVSAPEQLSQYNWEIAAVFDSDPGRWELTNGGLEVVELARLEEVVRGLGIDTAVLALPEREAQAAADRLVEAGVEAILNLAAVPVTVPQHVAVQQADLATQLMLLSYQAGLLERPKGK